MQEFQEARMQRNATEIRRGRNPGGLLCSVGIVRATPHCATTFLHSSLKAPHSGLFNRAGWTDSPQII